MRVFKPLRRWASGVVAVALLFAQLAEAAYVCPGFRDTVRAAVSERVGEPARQHVGGPVSDPATRPRETASASAATAGAAPCALMSSRPATMDPDLPGLCFQHCQADTGQPPPDNAGSVVVQLPAAPLLFQLAAAVPPVAQAPAWLAREHQRERAPPDAHRVAHCCYRI